MFGSCNSVIVCTVIFRYKLYHILQKVLCSLFRFRLFGGCLPARGCHTNTQYAKFKGQAKNPPSQKSSSDDKDPIGQESLVKLIPQSTVVVYEIYGVLLCGI